MLFRTSAQNNIQSSDVAQVVKGCRALSRCDRTLITTKLKFPKHSQPHECMYPFPDY